MLGTSSEQKRILQFNNQNLHNTNIVHIRKYCNMLLIIFQRIININYI